VYGAVPLVMLTVNEVDPPTQLVAEAGVIEQEGFGNTVSEFEQLVGQPKLSATCAT
jgi:hypothetical protein